MICDEFVAYFKGLSLHLPEESEKNTQDNVSDRH
jgi:hypothetical protein